MWSMRPRELFGLIAALLGGRLRRLHNSHGIVVLSDADPSITMILPRETCFKLAGRKVVVSERV